MFTFALALLSLTSDLSGAEGARLAELVRDPAVQCFSVAKGRSTAPIRENYLTYSDVVAEIPARSVFLGKRVEGENKVLVLTPTALGPIGIVRHSFVEELHGKEFRSEHCGDVARLFAPPFDTLKGWGDPLPGTAPNPSVANADVVLHQGCYRAKKGAVLRTPEGRVRVDPGTVLFAGDPLDGKGVSAKLQALDPATGKTTGTIARSKLERVALSACGTL